MEAIEGPQKTNSVEEKCPKDTEDVIVSNTETLIETDVCHTSNGVTAPEDEDLKIETDTETVVQDTVADDGELVTKFEEDYADVADSTETEVANVSTVETDNLIYSDEVVETEISTEINEAVSTEVEIGDTFIETQVVEESIVEVDGIVHESAENITFETEIFIESNSAELDDEAHAATSAEPDSSNILNELGQNIELSDVLRSSDISETVENNNCEPEVFNKEELIDILEGNDIEQNRKVISENFNADSKKLEEHLAMQQLHRLKNNDSRKRNRNSPKKPEKKQPKRSSSQYALREVGPKVNETTTSQSASKETKAKVSESLSSLSAPKEAKEKVTETINVINADKETRDKGDAKSNLQTAPKEIKIIEASAKNVTKKVKAKVDVESKPKKESIVNSLVQDWSDDEPMDQHETNTPLNENEAVLESTEGLDKSQESAVLEEDIQNKSQDIESTVTNIEPSTGDELTPNNKSNDETQPQRRLGRVIKKKVIFDPDNPDTFTKTKVHVKKEKDALPEKDQSAQTTPKKIKPDQPAQAPKTKSPVSKMQWKKPQPKNSNRQSSKRLTEIDRLLMDEGAVNMICQLTPEALKGNKNMKSRAEFIKNIQSNTPDKKEMKFRERKSKLKSEDGDDKKLGSAKHRLSLSSSVKSPAVSEDFENHSADDSIIYRRHSSSSYSSSCMSPRRLSDAEGGFGTQNLSQVATKEVQQESEIGKNCESNIFMEKTSTPRRDIMNRSDCLSIKEKLNSKLSQALNKRKLSSLKTEKPSKVKKVLHQEEISTDVTVHFNQKVAEICIREAGSLFSVQIMKVLENILALVDANKDVTVTLITSESGKLCSGLDLKPILDDVKFAHQIADHARSLMRSLTQHTKLVVIGVQGKIQGFGLALAALGDVLLASENASFTLAEPCNAVLHPGAGALSSSALPKDLLNELIIFGRELSAAEALRGGLVSRVIWPDRFQDQVRAIAKDIASQPYHNIMLKKRLLGLKKLGSTSTFLTCLENERDILVNYWTSAEGMELLRANHDAA